MSKVFTAKGTSRRVDPDLVRADEEELVEGAIELDMDEALAAHVEALVDNHVVLGRRTCRGMAIAWLWAARRHLDMVRRESGTLEEPLEGSPDRAGRPKDVALAGALYLLLFCGELDSLEAFERVLVEAAYVPLSGETDRAPYCAHRLPDSELAARVLGAPRGHAREARDRLLTVLLAITERWWQRFPWSRARAGSWRERLLAHLAWQTFSPTVYDAWRLESVRPEGRGDLDFQRWRGSETMGRKRRGGGPKPPGPRPGLPEPVARAYVRGELSSEEESTLARHLILRAPAAEIRQLADLAEGMVPGVAWFERLCAVAASASDGAVAFLVRLESGVPVPAMLEGDRRVLTDGEVVVVRVDPIETHGWVAVLGRVDGGAPEWVLRWTPLSPGAEAVEVCGYVLDEGEDEVDLLVAVVRQAPSTAADTPLVLEALGEQDPGEVRWGACRLVKRGTR